MSLCVRMDEWMLGPPVLMGDRVAWVGTEEPVLATVRWLGRLPDLYPQEMVAGISLVRRAVACCKPLKFYNVQLYISFVCFLVVRLEVLLRRQSADKTNN